MTDRLNFALRDVLTDAHAAEFDGGKVDIYSGAQPADANSAATGTLLVTVDMPDPAFGASVEGVATKTGSWFGVAVAGGTAGWFRMRNDGDTVRKDGTVSDDGSGELDLDTLTIVADGVVVVNNATITTPAEPS